MQFSFSMPWWEVAQVQESAMEAVAEGVDPAEIGYALTVAITAIMKKELIPSLMRAIFDEPLYQAVVRRGIAALGDA